TGMRRDAGYESLLFQNSESAGACHSRENPCRLARPPTKAERPNTAPSPGYSAVSNAFDSPVCRSAVRFWASGRGGRGFECAAIAGCLVGGQEAAGRPQCHFALENSRRRAAVRSLGRHAHCRGSLPGQTLVARNLWAAYLARSEAL